jgi:hypothetical protein
MVKKLEWIEMAQLATIPVPVGKERARKKKRAIPCRERLGGLLKYCEREAA